MSYNFISTVLMITALLSLQMHVEEYFVLYMNKNMGPSVMFVDVRTTRDKEQMLVMITRLSGRDIKIIILASSYLAFEDFYGDLVRMHHGSQ